MVRLMTEVVACRRVEALLGSCCNNTVITRVHVWRCCSSASLERAGVAHETFMSGGGADVLGTAPGSSILYQEQTPQQKSPPRGRHSTALCSRLPPPPPPLAQGLQHTQRFHHHINSSTFTPLCSGLAHGCQRSTGHMKHPGANAQRPTPEKDYRDLMEFNSLGSFILCFSLNCVLFKKHFW